VSFLTGEAKANFHLHRSTAKAVKTAVVTCEFRLLPVGIEENFQVFLPLVLAMVGNHSH
jgi:hypothetical protein